MRTNANANASDAGFCRCWLVGVWAALIRLYIVMAKAMRAFVIYDF